MSPPADDQEFQIALHGPICPQLLREDAVVVDEDGWYRTVTPSSPWAADNEVLFSNLDPGDVEAAITTTIADYHALGRPMRWCVYPWSRPADLGARLIERGARHWDVRAFVCDTTLPLEPVEDVEIERVTPGEADAFDAYIGLMTTGWDLPADEVAFRRRRYPELIAGSGASMQLFIARHRGVAAGCGAMVIKPDSAYLTGDYVVPAFQARGLFQSLLAARLRALREMGVTIASGHAREKTSAPWLQRFGFRTKFTYRIYQLEPPSPAA